MKKVLAISLSMWLAACSDEGMSRTGVVPWHMWGDSKVVDTVGGGGGGVGTQTTQITRINYARPETWRWNWRVDILEGGVSPGGGSITVVLDVTVGVGRASHKLRIGRFLFAWGAGQIPTFPNSAGSKWATSVNGPNPDDSVVVVPASTPLQNVIDHFVAQDVQVEASAQFVEAANIPLKYQVTALFSPETHVRPEWFTSIGHFPGQEDEGN